MYASPATTYRAAMARVVVIPGIGNSGPGHWQTLWESEGTGFVRIAPQDWDRPELEDWVGALEAAAVTAGADSVLVAHSLGCLAVAHWAARTRARVSGALLVAVPDPEGAAFPPKGASFAQPPLQPLDFPSLVVASSDDMYGSVEHARRCAAAWRSRFVEIGTQGHINAASGLGAWAQGRSLLADLGAA
jgi:hypothetical protein